MPGPTLYPQALFAAPAAGAGEGGAAPRRPAKGAPAAWRDQEGSAGARQARARSAAPRMHLGRQAGTADRHRIPDPAGLAQRPGFVKSRDSLMDAAYDDQVYVDDRTIDSHIKRLRKKFKVVDDISTRSNALWRRLPLSRIPDLRRTFSSASPGGLAPSTPSRLHRSPHRAACFHPGCSRASERTGLVDERLTRHPGTGPIVASTLAEYATNHRHPHARCQRGRAFAAPARSADAIARTALYQPMEGSSRYARLFSAQHRGERELPPIDSWSQ